MVLVTALTVVCLVLVAVNLLSGPRLTAFDVDATEVVSEANARLVLSANQPINEVDANQVTLSPARPFSVQTSGDSIVISFAQPLAYDTHYTVSVRDVTGVATDRTSTFEGGFRTEEPPLLYLSRDDAGPDRIVRTTIGSPDSAVAFQADRILEFVPFGERLAVVSLDDAGASVLSLVDEGGAASLLTVPGIGQIEDLHGAVADNLLGFRFTSAADAPGPRYENVLFMLDLGQGVADPVIGLDGEPLQVVDWSFMAGRTELVAQLYDTTLLLVNPRTNRDGTADPIPIGQYSRLAAVAPDGLRIAVSDQSAQFVLDLSTGTEAAIIPQAVDGTTRYTDEMRFLTGGDGYVQRMAEFDPVTGQVQQRLTLVTGTGPEVRSRVIYEPASDEESIVGFGLSPNDQYVAVQIVPNRQVLTSDEYPANAQAQEATTLFVSLETGEIRRSVVGFDVYWR
ncbi:hypothetical protein GY21_10640 [Cryobacterium roopkundense]|nr:hypothetical protein GY21_10640 [Cryobacterium roopkundense]